MNTRVALQRNFVENALRKYDFLCFAHNESEMLHIILIDITACSLLNDIYKFDYYCRYYFC